MAMSVHDRKVELFRRGVTTRSLAQTAECSPQMIRAVIDGKEKSPRIRRVIAAAMRRPVSAVFEPL
jgi:lambda repressor-like predicted transcriptional regulator